MYKWMHDQSMRLANKGHVATEIAEALALPDEFLANDHTRGYYGDLIHNSKAVYQRYLSWYDGNPANLNKYSPVEAGKRYVELAGGMDALLSKARAAFDAGDYKWVVEIVNHAVFADPTHTAARELQADALEQLGYQSESSTFRNAYLMGAQELRQGPPKPSVGAVRARGLLKAMTIEQVFDSISVRIKQEELGGVTMSTNWTFDDVGETWVLGVSNRTLWYSPGRHDADAAVSVTMRRSTFIEIVTQQTTFMDQISAGQILIEGDAAALLTIFGNLDEVSTSFPIVEP
jgi:alkyl sulfatase BDS1-like metallo-beta-lactamase superfamily hydrolase